MENFTKKYRLSEKKLKKTIGFNPHENQQKILDGLKRYTCITSGRRFGKTLLASYLAMKQLLLSERTVWVVAPTYSLAKRVWNYVYKWVLWHCPGFKVNQQDLSIENPLTQSILELKTAENPTSCIGAGVDLLIIDEASRVKDQVWLQALSPTLADKQGSAVFISTPRGRNWFYNMYLQGKDKNQKDYASFSFETQDNLALPHLKEEQEKARMVLPENVYRQEYRAKFVEDAGQVFRGIKKCVRGSLMSPERTHNYVMGVDLAKHEDFTVITVIDLTDFSVVAFERFNRIDWEFQRIRIETMSDLYRKCPIVIDATGVGDPGGDLLKRDGYPVMEYKYTNASKKYLIENLALKIERNEVSFPEIPELIDELESFGYELTPSRQITYQAPAGYHDDCVNSLALAVHGAGHYVHKPVQVRDPYPPGSMGALVEKIEKDRHLDEIEYFI